MYATHVIHIGVCISGLAVDCRRQMGLMKLAKVGFG